jgi:hypothetical protein
MTETDEIDFQVMREVWLAWAHLGGKPDAFPEGNASSFLQPLRTLHAPPDLLNIIEAWSESWPLSDILRHLRKWNSQRAEKSAA